MIKKLMVALVMLLPTPVMADQAMKDNMLDPVIKIYSGEAENGRVCSATSIGKGLFLTSYHCLDKSQEGYTIEEKFVKDKLVKKTYYGFKAIKGNVINDIAVIKFDDPDFSVPEAIMADNLLLKEGDDVWAVGYPAGLTRVISKGLFNQLLPKPVADKYQFWYRTTAQVYHGNSGGALFQKNGDHYELIGVTAALLGKDPGIPHLTVSVPLDIIKEFLK